MLVNRRVGCPCPLVPFQVWELGGRKHLQGLHTGSHYIACHCGGRLWRHRVRFRGCKSLVSFHHNVHECAQRSFLLPAQRHTKTHITETHTVNWVTISRLLRCVKPSVTLSKESKKVSAKYLDVMFGASVILSLIALSHVRCPFAFLAFHKELQNGSLSQTGSTPQNFLRAFLRQVLTNNYVNDGSFYREHST